MLSRWRQTGIIKWSICWDSIVCSVSWHRILNSTLWVTETCKFLWCRPVSFSVLTILLFRSTHFTLGFLSHTCSLFCKLSNAFKRIMSFYLLFPSTCSGKVFKFFWEKNWNKESYFGLFDTKKKKKKKKSLRISQTIFSMQSFLTSFCINVEYPKISLKFVKLM